MKMHHIAARTLDAHYDQHFTRSLTGLDNSDKIKKTVTMHALLHQVLEQPDDVPADIGLLGNIGDMAQTVVYVAALHKQYPAIEKNGQKLTYAQMKASLFNGYMNYLTINQDHLLPEYKKQAEENKRLDWINHLFVPAKELASTADEKTRLHDFIMSKPTLWNGDKMKTKPNSMKRSLLEIAGRASPVRYNETKAYYLKETKTYMIEGGGGMLFLQFGDRKKKTELESAIVYNFLANRTYDAKSIIEDDKSGRSIERAADLYRSNISEIKKHQAKQESSIHVL